MVHCENLSNKAVGDNCTKRTNEKLNPLTGELSRCLKTTSIKTELQELHRLNSSACLHYNLTAQPKSIPLPAPFHTLTVLAAVGLSDLLCGFQPVPPLPCYPPTSERLCAPPPLTASAACLPSPARLTTSHWRSAAKQTAVNHRRPSG